MNKRILDFLIRIISRVLDHVSQLGGDIGGQSRNSIKKLGGFKLLKVLLSFQVHEPGFWGMFEKRQNLDVDGVDFVVYFAVMMLLHRNLTLIAEKIKVEPLFVYFEFAVMNTGSEVLSIEDG